MRNGIWTKIWILGIILLWANLLPGFSGGFQKQDKINNNSLSNIIKNSIIIKVKKGGR
jgi:hypothetical protein